MREKIMWEEGEEERGGGGREERGNRGAVSYKSVK